MRKAKARLSSAPCPVLHLGLGERPDQQDLVGVPKGGGWARLEEGVWLLVRVETAFGKGNSPRKVLLCRQLIISPSPRIDHYPHLLCATR